MGSVWLARDETLGRLVAVKLISEQLWGHGTASARFLREARAMATVEHPHIVRLYSLGEADGRPYAVMEYVQGQTLAQRLQREGALSEPEALRIVHQVAEALQAAWDKHLVHRDVKPANILLDSKGQVRVVDFGLAKPLHAGSSEPITQEARFVGTPHYAAPEQARGQEVDFRADLYSLGIVLYEMLAGTRPFDGDTPLGIIDQHLNKALPALRQRQPEASEAVERLLGWMTHKDPQQRPASYAELLQSIELPVPAPRRRSMSAASPSGTSMTVSVVMPSRRRKVLLLAGLAIAVLALAATLAWVRRELPASAVPQHRQLTFVGDAQEPILSPDGNSLAYVTGVESKDQKLLLQDMAGGPVLELLRRPSIEHQRWSPDGSEIVTEVNEGGQLKSLLIRRLGGSAREIPPAAHWCYSPDGSRLAGAMVNSKAIDVIDKSTGAATSISLEPSFRWLMAIDWSPADDFLLFLAVRDEGSAIYSVKPDGSQQTKVVDQKGGIFSPRWSQRGDAIYYLRQPAQTKELMKVPIEPGTGAPQGPPSILLSGLLAGPSFSISRDGRRLAYTRELSYSNLWLGTVEETTGEKSLQTTQLTTGTSIVYDASLSPDGRQIVFSMGDTDHAELYTLPMEGGSPRQLTFLKDFSSSAVWSPDGKRIAFVSFQGGVSRVWTMNADGGIPRPFAQTETNVYDVGSVLAWAPGPRILYQRPGNQNFNILDPETEQETPLVPGNQIGWISRPEVSPDGKRVAVFWNRQARAGLWALSLVDSMQLFLGGILFPVGWSSDGHWIYAIGRDEQTSHIVRVSAENGEAEPFVTLPFNLPQVCSMSPDARQVLFIVEETYSDVWLVENFDPDLR